jgi:hypothetical protein
MRCLEYIAVQVHCNVYINTSVFMVSWLRIESGTAKYEKVSFHLRCSLCINFMPGSLFVPLRIVRGSSRLTITKFLIRLCKHLYHYPCITLRRRFDVVNVNRERHRVRTRR